MKTIKILWKFVHKGPVENMRFVTSEVTGSLTACSTAFFQANIKGSIVGSLWGKFTGDQLIPLSKDQ